VNKEQHNWWGADQRKWKLLLRDIVATNSSLISNLDEIKFFSRQTDMAAVEWIATMQEGLNYLASHPQDMIQIHYEQLVNEPKKILLQLLDFCDLANDQVLLDYAQQTMRTTPAKKPFTLHPTITRQFNETMDQLGYKKRIVK
ncbi:MAG: sulfotransferase, partial [Chloroflexi bacterium]|nr:sulfotransferase [Chloroflexota bacterium]